MQWVYSDTQRSVERLLDRPNPSASLLLKPLGPEATRQVLNYQIAEQNRYYRESWETAQLILGCFFFFFMLFFTREDKISLAIALLMLVIVAVQRFYMTPDVSAMGRVGDFIAAEVYLPGRHRAEILAKAYDLVEISKVAMGMVLAGWLILGRGKRRSRTDIRQELDMINKANYRHIDR